MQHPVRALLLRELATLRRELEAYPEESQLWILPPGLPNSGGTLALHLAGNLQHFIGAVLGGTGYRRDRPAEFSRRDVPRAELLAEVDATRTAIEAGFERLTPSMMAGDYPEVLNGYQYQTEDFLTHLAVHIGFHLGQLDYHRRVVTGEMTSAKPLAMTELLTATRVSGER